MYSRQNRFMCLGIYEQVDLFARMAGEQVQLRQQEAAAAGLPFCNPVASDTTQQILGMRGAETKSSHVMHAKVKS